MMKNTSQEIFDTDLLLQELVQCYHLTYLSDLRKITLSDIYLRFNSDQKIQRYDLQTWSKALTYITGNYLVFQDCQSLVSTSSGTSSP